MMDVPESADVRMVCRVEGTTPKRRDKLLKVLRDLLSDYPDVDVGPINALL